MMVGLDSMRVMDILADTTNTISEGEVLQLLNMGDPEISEAAYLTVIENKTARLFEAACQLGAVLGGQPEAVESALAEYGRQLGCAFQVADDVLDYSGDGAQLGKNVGDDLAEGKPTLPLIYARELATDDEKQLIDTAVRQGGTGHLEQILEILHRTAALQRATGFARARADAALHALAQLPPSPWRDAMAFLASYSVQRDH
jgi:octaprenyl-diphosphate synthase